MREFTLAELRERREQRRVQTITKRSKPKKPRRNKFRKPKQGNKVIVTSVSIMPELKIRAERELGGGNFSRAVTYALTQCLLELDQASGKPNSSR